MNTLVPPRADQWTAFGLPSDSDGLSDDQFREIVRLVCQLPGRWLIERCEDESGIVSVLLELDVEGADGLNFALFRHAREINLDLGLGGRFEPLGTFRTVERAMDRVLNVAWGATHLARSESVRPE